MAAEWVRLTVAEGVATVVMERPPVNAMSAELVTRLRTALQAAAVDPSVRAIVVASALPGVFSAGADIRQMEGLDREACAAFVARGHDLFALMGGIGKPIIAAIDGVCLGGGLELAMACDLRVAAESARLGQPEVDLGVISGWGGTQRLPRLVGRGRGLELLMLGEAISASTALAWGLVHRVVADASVRAEATGLARKLAAKSAVALARIKEAVELGLSMPLEEGLREEARCYVEAYLSTDAREGIRAFLDRRGGRSRGDG